MNLFKSKAFKKGALYVTVFGVSLAATFLIAKNVSKPSSSRSYKNEEASGEVNMKPGERLLNSLLEYKALEFDADVNIKLEDNTIIDLGVDGQGKINDIENIELLGDLDANLDGTRLGGQFGYFGDEMIFSVDGMCDFRLKTTDLTDFIDMVPKYGISINLPESLSSLSIDDLTNAINAIEESDKKTTPSGDYYYNISFGSDTEEGDKAFNVMILTDTNDAFKGIRVDTFYYQGTKFSLNASLREISEEEYTVVNPLLDVTTSAKYQDFAPVFTLFDCLYDLTKQETLGVDVLLTLDNKNADTQEYEELLNADLDLDLDLNNNVYGIAANVSENSRNHVLNFALQEQTIYASFHNVKVSMTMQSISGLIQYALDTISSETLDGLLGKLTESTSDLDLAGITEKIENMLKGVSISSGNLNITLDLSEFGLDYTTPLVLGVDFNNEGIERIYVQNTKINDYGFALEISFRDYVAPIINAEEYQSIQQALPLLPAIINLLDDTQFRIELDACVHDTQNTEAHDITVDGGVQFELDPNRNEESNKGYGYGELTIVDSNEYTHKIEADMKSVEEILFSYNDTLNGKFNIQTLKDLVDVLMDVIKNKDDDAHFQELFGELLNKLNDSPISQALNGNFGILLNYDIISNLEITDTHVSMDINFEVFGMEDASMHMEINYVVNDMESADVTLQGLSISNLTLAGKEISANVNLTQFDESLESTRLDPSEEYLDFSDIKVLLELGLNTSKFNYYHFTLNVNANVKISIFPSLLDFDFPIDVKIRNDHGNVQVAAEIESFPTPLSGLANSGDYYYANNRSESIYYQDGYVYLHRSEKVGKSFLDFGANHNYELIEVMTGDYFMDNAIDVICRDMVGFGPKVMNLIKDGDLSNGSNVIHYEKILQDFQYNEADKFFEFDLDLNELTGTNIFTSTVLKINHDDDISTDKPILTGVDAELGLSLLGFIKVNASLTLEFLEDRSIELSEENRLTKLESFISTYHVDTDSVSRTETLD